MTGIQEEPPVGTLHQLDEHRPVPVQLTKEETTGPREVLEGVVIPSGGEAPAEASRWRRAAGVTLHAATHDRTKTGARLAIRHSAYVAGGARIVARRAWDGRSAARYERMIRTAEAAGNREEAALWEEKGTAFRAARHARRMELLKAPQHVAKGLAVGAGTATGGLFGLGVVMAIAEKDIALTVAPLMFTVDTIQKVIWLAGIIWGPAVFFGPWLGLLALWNLGRRGEAAPAWALPARQRGDFGVRGLDRQGVHGLFTVAREQHGVRHASRVPGR